MVSSEADGEPAAFSFVAALVEGLVTGFVGFLLGIGVGGPADFLSPCFYAGLTLVTAVVLLAWFEAVFGYFY